MNNKLVVVIVSLLLLLTSCAVNPDIQDTTAPPERSYVSADGSSSRMHTLQSSRKSCMTKRRQFRRKHRSVVRVSNRMMPLLWITETFFGIRSFAATAAVICLPEKLQVVPEPIFLLGCFMTATPITTPIKPGAVATMSARKSLWRVSGTF